MKLKMAIVLVCCAFPIGAQNLFGTGSYARKDYFSPYQPQQAEGIAYNLRVLAERQRRADALREHSDRQREFRGRLRGASQYEKRQRITNAPPPPGPTPDHWKRLAKQGAPDRLPSTSLDPLFGYIVWPSTLRAEEYARPRESLAEIFEIRAQNGGVISQDAFDKIQAETTVMADTLKKHIRDYHPSDYILASKTIKGLSYEARFVGQSDLPASSKSIDELMSALDDKDPGVQFFAVASLADIGSRAGPALPKLITLLSSSDSSLLWQASRAIAGIGPQAKSAVNKLQELLKHDELLVRAHAVNALGQIGDASAPVVRSIAMATTDKDPHVRRIAVDAIRNLKPAPDVALPIAIKVLKDADPAVAAAALQSLAEGGKNAVPRLIKALSHPKARYWASLALAEIGADAKDAAPSLLPLLDAKESEIRFQALITLGRIGHVDSKIEESATKSLKDPEAVVRYAAAYVLGKLGSENAQIVLREAGRSEDQIMQMLSAWAVSMIDSQSSVKLERAVTKIFELFASEDELHRRIAARALLELKPQEGLVAERIMVLLKDTDDQVWNNAIGALAGLGPKAASRIAEGLRFDDLRRGKAIQVLTAMGKDAAPAVPDLIEALTNTNTDVVIEVLLALASIGSPASNAVPHLVKLLDHQTSEIRYGAAYCLGKIGTTSNESLIRLRKLASSNDEIMQIASVWAMVRIAPEDAQIKTQAVPLLIKGLTTFKRELARIECAAALGDMGSIAGRAIDPLREVSKSDTPEVSRAARDAVKRIQTALK